MGRNNAVNSSLASAPLALPGEPSVDFTSLAGVSIGRRRGQARGTQLLVGTGCRRWIEPVNFGVDRKETGDVPEPQQELGNRLFDRLLAVSDRSPRWLAGKEEPPQRVGTILVKDLRGLAVVPQAFAHFVAVLAQHQS